MPNQVKRDVSSSFAGSAGESIPKKNGRCDVATAVRSDLASR
jgi:hypothetical protein